MTTYKGVGVYAGRVIGPVLQMPKPIEEPKDGLRLSSETAEAAAQRIKDASVRVKEDNTAFCGTMPNRFLKSLIE